MRYLSVCLGICLVFAQLDLFSQLTLGRQVIGSAAVYGAAGSMTLSSTTGETAYSNLESASLQLKEGFEQNGVSPLVVAASVAFEDCWNGENARIDITQLSGCGGAESISLNGEPIAGTITGLAPGEYLLQVVGVDGCVFEETYTVEAPSLPPCGLDVYNTVTPNGDGKNDVWIIGNINQPEFAINNVTILNRWGQELWTAQNYDNTSVVWTGQDEDGNKLPQGTYYYKIEFDGQELTGFITLIQ
ncbi:MAG: gliding motility-associated C-terminal domain-containing protein [Flavobacteriales bacterium]|nr:gliding motility-associated C-terminal domain-containing protein [Flavobacteriales bacterium]MDG1779553.1 gliding motility-associated C-terminal domain-containing protein [Flavobacteriales bacterium]MDG2244730.1 gliding motility-associated C-terminal domain-containing protein [Flavobacteriales bacterium]